VPSPRSNEPRAASQALALAASIGLGLWARVARRPLDSLAVLGASAASLFILVNAVFLQKGPPPAPFFVPAPPTVAPPAMAPLAMAPPPAESHSDSLGAAAPKPAEAPLVAALPATSRAPQTIAVRRNDPIAQLIGTSSRVMAAQRVLSQLGYRQVKVSGVVDQATRAAIEKFERDHKLSVSGRLSERVVSELGAMAGHPIE
jgi:Putative peptidoglycan binding domain